MHTGTKMTTEKKKRKKEKDRETPMFRDRTILSTSIIVLKQHGDTSLAF